MCEPSNTSNTNIHPNQHQIQHQIHSTNIINNHSLSSLPIYKCHKCSSLISIDPSQIESINKQQKANNNNNNNDNDNNIKDTISNRANTSNTGNPAIALQCVYVNCSVRSKNLFECTKCNELSLCRNCNMPLCKSCRLNLKVLHCAYCASFICSQHCYTSLLKKYFIFLENFGISMDAHESMHFFRKLLLPPHLHSALANITDDNLPFHVCENCKAQNCGCIDWLSCVNCRKYYCIDCEHKVLNKCGLEDCQSYTCCHQQEWDSKCSYCNKLGNCTLIFCTKGHCNRHIIINREITYNEINNNKDDNNNNNNHNDGDIELTTNE